MLENVTNLFAQLDFPEVGSKAMPGYPEVRKIEAAIARGLAEETFIRDCVELELARLDDWSGLPALLPFHTAFPHGVRFCFGYFLPGQSTGAHEHTSWTVTALCHNDLEVLTFDREIAYAERRLVVDRTIATRPGKVGHIYHPCIHDARNPSKLPSLTLHLLSPNDGQAPADKDYGFNDARDAAREASPPPPEEAFARIATWRKRQAYLRILAEFTRERAPALARPLLDAIARRGSLQTQSACRGLGAGAGPRLDSWRDARLTLRADLPELASRPQDSHVDLVVVAPRGELTLLRLARWASPLLDRILGERSLCPGNLRNLPWSLDPDETFRLVEQLDEWGLLEWKGLAS